MDRQYKLQNENYILIDRDEELNSITNQPEVILMTKEVSLAFDKESGVLHKHGNPELVEAWANNAKKSFRDGGFTEMAEDIIVMSGKFPVEELNKCLNYTGYSLILYKKLIDLHQS
jgi:hypothetical protein